MNILGYIPGVSTVSGTVRMIAGAALYVGTLGLKQPSSDDIHITGLAQVTRGLFEAVMPLGHLINLTGDIGASGIQYLELMLSKEDQEAHRT